MKPIGNSGYRAGAATEGRAEPDTLNEAAATASLQGQAREPVTVAQPPAGETMIVKAEPGAVYLLDFAPESVNFAVEGDNIVMTFDLDGDGTADSQVIFLDLAGMAGDTDAPTLLIAGVDYDVSALLDGAEAFLQARGLTEAEDAQLPGGPAVETEGGETPQSGGSSEYNDDLGSQAFSDGTEALSGVGGPLGADFGPGVTSGTVITGLPRPAAQDGRLPSPSGGGDGGDGGANGGDGDGIETVAGQVVDGYVASATVFRDANGNGALDDDEVFTTTDINGNFTLTGGSGSLVAIGGTDVSTGLPFDGVLKAPEGATVITPLTTLVQNLVEGGQTAAAAETQVKQALGIDAGFSLSTTDPVKSAAGGDAAALQAVKAGIAVANTATQVKAALTGAGSSNAEVASNAAFKAIANKINANATSGETTDLKDTAQVSDVLNDAATNGGATFDNNDVANAAKVITATNTAVESVDTSGGSTVTEALTNLAKVAQVAQSGASTAIENAVQSDNDNDVDSYDDATKVETEADSAEVGDVDGSDTLTAGDDTFHGGAGGDSFDGLAGNDVLFGEGGADAISGGADNDLIYGGDGNDVIQGGTGNDTLYGDAGNDDIAGDAGNDLIFGGDGNDTLTGGAGNDTINGGDGIDTVRFDGRAGDYRFDFAEDGTLTVTRATTGEVDSLTNVERLRFVDGKTMILGDGTVDLSGLGAVNVVFGTLGELTQITTAAGQSLQLDGGQIDLISEADDKLIIVGGAAVNIVNADLVIWPDGSAAPSVNNLLGLEFDGLDAAKSLIPGNLTIDGSHTAGFAAFWIPLDQLYVGSNDYYDLTINTSFVYLGNDYASYLLEGGEALLDLVKVPDGRLQTLHDNLLGNLADGPIASRFTNHPSDPQPDPRTADGDTFGGRPYHDGVVNDAGLYANAQKAAAVVAWDIAHDVSYPDVLPSPFGVLDAGVTLNGTVGDDLFFGGGGNDSIDGGDGDDAATYLGSRFDYTVASDADGTVTVADNDTAAGADEGSDSLTSIETLYFADGMLSFGATLARAVPEVGDGNDGFHPGTGNSDVNFAIHDNTEAKVEAAIKAIARYHGDLESKGQTYYAKLGFSDRDGDGLADENSDVGFWNFSYSIVDYGDADLSKYDIRITADFEDVNGQLHEGVLDYDPISHDELTGEAYYQDGSGSTAGNQNSQNLSWNSDSYNAGVPGTYTVVLTVTDKESGKVVAQTQMQVVVKADITVGEDGIDTIQDAIDAAQAGDTIYVPAGTYNETVTINKLVKLYGAFGDVNGSDASRGVGGETILVGGIRLLNPADGTTIDGFTIQDGDTIGGGETAGIWLAPGASDIIIENNVFVGDGSFTGARGILTSSGGTNSGVTISDNSFTGWSTGVYLNPGSTDAEISGNVFDGNYVGVSVDAPDGAVIAGSSFTNNAYEGLGLGPGAGDLTVTLTDNSFSDNGADTDGRNIGVWGDGLTVSSDSAGSGTVLVLQDGIVDITLQGSGDLSVIGNDEDNFVTGNDGANRLEGGAGADSLIGGDGADVFVYSDILDGGDLIVGFDGDAGDRIDLGLLFDALGLSAADLDARVNIDQTGTDATIALDADGDGSFEVTLVTVADVTGDLTGGHLALLAA